MNSQLGKNRRIAGVVIAPLVALAIVASIGRAAAAGAKYETEDFGFDMKALKTKGLSAPMYSQSHDGKLLVSDHAAGIFSVTLSGAATQMAKVPQAGGVAVAPAGFGAYAGQVFVNAPSGDASSPCVVSRIDIAGTPTVFAKLPDAGGGKPSDCRGLEFGPASGPFAGKLYAVANGNSTVYVIDPSGGAKPFGTYEKLELTDIGFAPDTDPKAPGAMLIGSRPMIPGGTKIGRLASIDASGKMSSDPYLVGFVRPTGFGFAPAGFGEYQGVLFIADAGKWAADSEGDADGRVYRVYKGIAREFANGMVDPTSMKFAGKTMVLCDPAAKGKTGAIVTIAPMY